MRQICSGKTSCILGVHLIEQKDRANLGNPSHTMNVSMYAEIFTPLKYKYFS